MQSQGRYLALALLSRIPLLSFSIRRLLCFGWATISKGALHWQWPQQWLEEDKNAEYSLLLMVSAVLVSI